MHEFAIQVSIHRDFWDWVVVGATVLAVAIAVVAIVVATKADRAVVRERQLTFELDVLTRLANACARYWADGRSEVVALLLLLPDDLPGLRQYVGDDHAPGQDVLEAFADEYRQAVNRRLYRQRRPAAWRERYDRWSGARDWQSRPP
jgi:hypothetical protein